MSHPDLGYAVLINNLALENPDTVSEAEALEQTLKEIGFKVKSYKDLNIQVTTSFSFSFSP